MTTPAPAARRDPLGWIRPYLERAPLAALLLGISSGFPYAMIGATLTTRLAQDGIDKKSVTAFALAFLVYNIKFLWAPLVDRFHLPLLGRLGQRRSWLWLTAAAVAAATINLGLLDPSADLARVALAAAALGGAGSTFHIVMHAYRIHLMRPEHLGGGSGMSQYSGRRGAAGDGQRARVGAGGPGPAPVVAVADRGGGGRGDDQPGPARPERGPGAGRVRRGGAGRGRLDLRHRHRRLPHRTAASRTAGRGLGHVAVRLAAGRGRRRRAGAAGRRAAGLGRGIRHLRSVRAAGGVRRLLAGRTDRKSTRLNSSH